MEVTPIGELNQQLISRVQLGRIATQIKKGEQEEMWQPRQ
jgi:hypothetical protein